MALRLVTPPGSEPVTLDEAKRAAEWLTSDRDDLIGALITSARQMTEHELGRALITQEWEKTLDAFPGYHHGYHHHCDVSIRLDHPPVTYVEAVQYRDTNGAWQTLAQSSYVVDTASEPAWIQPAYGTTWPSTHPEINSVVIRYRAGYGDAVAVPQAIRTYIRLHVADFLKNREATTEAAHIEPLPFLGGLLDPYRIWSLA